VSSARFLSMTSHSLLALFEATGRIKLGLILYFFSETERSCMEFKVSGSIEVHVFTTYLILSKGYLFIRVKALFLKLTYV